MSSKFLNIDSHKDSSSWLLIGRNFWKDSWEGLQVTYILSWSTCATSEAKSTVLEKYLGIFTSLIILDKTHSPISLINSCYRRNIGRRSCAIIFLWDFRKGSNSLINYSFQIIPVISPLSAKHFTDTRLQSNMCTLIQTAPAVLNLSFMESCLSIY